MASYIGGLGKGEDEEQDHDDDLMQDGLQSREDEDRVFNMEDVPTQPGNLLAH